MGHGFGHGRGRGWTKLTPGVRRCEGRETRRGEAKRSRGQRAGGEGGEGDVKQGMLVDDRWMEMGERG